MNHIQKTYLKSNPNKLFTFQPMKVNYAFTSNDGADLARDEEATRIAESNKNLFVQFDVPGTDGETTYPGSFVVILMRQPTVDELVPGRLGALNPNLQVVDIESAPPGSNGVSFVVSQNQVYYLYILSDRHEDGYLRLNEENRFELVPAGDFNLNEYYKIEWDGNNDIVLAGISLTENVSEDQWYKYDGVYDGPILWQDPTLYLPTDDDNRYLIAQKEYLEAIAYSLTNESGSFSDSALDSYIANLATWVDNPSFNEARPRIGPERAPIKTTIQAAEGLYAAARLHDSYRDDPNLTRSPNGLALIEDFSGLVGDGNEFTRNLLAFPYAQKFRDVPSAPQTRSVINAAAKMGALYEMIWLPYTREYGETNIESVPSERAISNLPFSNIFASIVSDITPPSPDSQPTFEARSLLRNTRAKIYQPDGGGSLNEESTQFILEDGGYEILDALKRLVPWEIGTNEEENALALEVVEYFRGVHSELAQYVEGTNFDDLIGGVFLPVTRAYTDYVTWKEDALRSAYAAAREVQSRLRDTNDLITQLGSDVFRESVQTTDPVRLSHEGTLQNIRFLRSLLEAFKEDTWTQGTNFNSFIVERLDRFASEITQIVGRANTIASVTDALVSPNDVEVLVRPDGGDWVEVGAVHSVGNNVLEIDLSTALTDVGGYTVLVRPASQTIRIQDVRAFSTVVTPDLQDEKSENYYFGYNIQFFEPGQNLRPLGEPRMIVSSVFRVGAHELLVSPNIYNKQDFAEDTFARIWPSSFIPLIAHIDVTEHNIETLSYAHYGKREFNTNTGVLTLFKPDGTIYRQWTVGERATAEEGFDPIEFREPF